MAKKKRVSLKHEHFHKDGTLWARGTMKGNVMASFCDGFRKKRG